MMINGERFEKLREVKLSSMKAVRLKLMRECIMLGVIQK